MNENVPYSSGGCSETVPSFGDIEVNTSNFSEQFGVNNTTTTSINNSSEFSFRDDNLGATCSTEKDIEGGLLEDIFHVLSEVPLHATQALQEYCHHNLEASTSKNDEFFMQDKRGIPSYDYTNIVAQGSQMGEEREAKEDTLQLLSEPVHTPPFDESHDHIPTRRRNREQRRRARINTKLRALQALLPHSGKKDHASILDNAINYIKSLKVQVEMLSSARLTGPSEHQASNYPPAMNVGGAGFTQWPLHFPMDGPFNYPRMIQPNFPFQPVPHYFTVTQFFAPRNIPPLLPPPQLNAPIRLWTPNPYIGISNSSAGRATRPAPIEQSGGLFTETNLP